MPWITVFSAVEKDSIVGELKSAGVRFTVTEKSYPAQTVAGNNMPAVSMWSVKAEGGK